MAIKMLVFDYRKTEHKFFKENRFDNYDIKFFEFPLNEETFGDLSEDDRTNTSIISIFVDSSLSKGVINGFKNLRAIATRSTGYDNINKRICQQRNIAVLNVQNYGETAVAEFTLGVMIGLVRKIPNAVMAVKRADYSKNSFVGRDLEKLTLGVVGTGAIGAAVCKLANAFGMRILAYDLIEKTELIEKCNVNYTTFEFMIRNSDVITLHLPYTGDNYHMFSKREFDLMKQDSYFINVSRGELAELCFLKEHLKNGKIMGAALDVVACEPGNECENFAKKTEISSLECLKDSNLIKEIVAMNNVVVTPHIAYESQDAIDYILKSTFEGIRDFINGGSKNRVI